MIDNSLFCNDDPAVNVRAVHLDLKGLQPTPQRLGDLLKIFAAARYNAVLVEWEDTFPWTIDPRFRSHTAYTADDVRSFLQAADRHKRDKQNCVAMLCSN